jgi:hypothetical protein
MKNKIITKIEYAFRVDSNFNNLYFTDGSVKYAEPTKPSRAGVIYEQRLSLFNPGDNDIVFSAWKGQKFKLKLTFSDGSVIIFDTLTYWEVEVVPFLERTKKGFDIVFYRNSLNPAL